MVNYGTVAAVDDEVPGAEVNVEGDKNPAQRRRINPDDDPNPPQTLALHQSLI